MKQTEIDIVILHTGLFAETDRMLEAVSTIDGLKTEMVELKPEQMGDADWDAVVELVLRSSKVVTV